MTVLNIVLYYGQYNNNNLYYKKINSNLFEIK